MKSKVEFSHLDKVFFPEAKITKGDLVEYYTQLSDYILPYLKDRPNPTIRILIT
jgi:bifunctional non-homologous end joining protein LigD